MRCIGKNEITIKALNNGRKVDEFNETFQKIADIFVAKIADFVSKRHIMQVLSQ